jgi:hypothetical protein
MRARVASIALLALLTAAAPGCGESGAKRSVDARTEALRFFSVDAPVVAVLHPDPFAKVVALNAAATHVPAWTDLRDRVLGPLGAAGVTPVQLGQLLRGGEDVDGTEASTLALGAATPADLRAGRQLLVLATEDSELLAKLLRDQARTGKLKPGGQLDEAKLYAGSGAAYAVRDGVLVAAPDLAAVRMAIERRDGDTDRQLDEDVVDSLFGELATQGPLLVYADLDQVRKADAGLRRLARQAPWTAKLGPTAASADARGGAVRIEDFSKTGDSEFSSGELPIGTEPSRFEITSSNAVSLIPEPGPVQGLLAGLTPLRGVATASSDEVHLEVRAGG